MKRIILAGILLTGIFISSKSNAQVFINARVGLPIPRVYVRPVPRVVCETPYVAPYYQDQVVVASPQAYYGNPYAGAYYYDHGRRFWRDGRYDRDRYEHGRYEHERWERHERRW